MELPRFRYHPDPVATGSVVPSDAPCPCCGRVTGMAYVGPVYSTQTVGNLCPWCVASGDAAVRFDAEFADSHPLARAGVPPAVVEEVTLRTPGYTSWQRDCWLTCCGDACEFHGAPRTEHLHPLPEATRGAFAEDHGEDAALRMLEGLEDWKPGGSLELYRFVCRHCGRMRLGFDTD